MKKYLIISILFSAYISHAQQTMGVDIYEKDKTQEGYIFFSPMRYTSAYLVDNCGFLVNEWSRFNVPGLSGYLTESGLMLRTNKVNNAQYSQASTGGNLELVDWDNNTVWSHDFNQFEYIQHHDAKLLENGNILFLGWERISPLEQVEYGRPTWLISNPNLWGEFVWEIKPIGSDDFEVVWEWHMQDHFIQEVDDSKSTYGDISENLGRIDINYQGPAKFDDDDWWHCNAIDYNAKYDQILINCRSNGEMWIIDHSTTTEEARGNTGGKYGKGGELLFRWGNTEAHDVTGYGGLKMYGSHGNYWIPDGLPNAGKIMYFNNGDERPEGYYSTVEMIDPNPTEDGFYDMVSGTNAYGPLESELVYQAPQPFDFLSYYLSNAQQLPNGNVFINEGGSGRLFEVDTDGNIVWQYRSPVTSLGPLNQGDFLSSSNRIFRAYKYTPDYPGLAGQILTSGDLLEGDSEFNICKPLSNEELVESAFTMWYDMSSATWSYSTEEKGSYTITSATGSIVKKGDLELGDHEHSLDDLQTGVYVISITFKDGNLVSKKIFR